MARGKKAAENLMVLIGLILFIGYSLLEFLSKNAVSVFGLVFLIAALVFLIKYFDQRNKTKEAEKEENHKKLLGDEAAKLQVLRESRKARIETAFRKSQDYQLIEGYVSKYCYHDYTSLDQNFKKLVEVISFSWELDRDSILNMIKVEAIGQRKVSFRKNVKKYNPMVYSDYLNAVLEAYGDNSDTYLDDLHNLLIEEYVILPQTPSSKTSSDLTNAHYARLREGLKKQLISDRSEIDIYDIDRMSPYQFEQFIAKMYEKHGYKVQTTKLTGDQGADVVLEKFGERIVIQVKLYSSPVGNKAVQEVCASLKHYNADKGIVVTNNYFTLSARELAVSNQIALIDRDQLRLMI